MSIYLLPNVAYGICSQNLYAYYFKYLHCATLHNIVLFCIPVFFSPDTGRKWEQLYDLYPDIQM